MYRLKEPQSLQPGKDHWGEHKIGATERTEGGDPKATKNAGHCGLWLAYLRPPVTPSTRKDLQLQENHSLGWARTPALCDFNCDLTLSPGRRSGGKSGGFYNIFIALFSQNILLFESGVQMFYLYSLLDSNKNRTALLPKTDVNLVHEGREL